MNSWRIQIPEKRLRNGWKYASVGRFTDQPARAFQSHAFRKRIDGSRSFDLL